MEKENEQRKGDGEAPGGKFSREEGRVGTKVTRRKRQRKALRLGGDRGGWRWPGQAGGGGAG